MIAKAPWVRSSQWGGAPPEPEIPRPSRSAERVAFEANLEQIVRAAMAKEFPSNRSQSAAFLGEWCGQGVAGVRASITESEPYLTLTNESGDASTGRVEEKGKIVALGWQNITGTLNPSGIQIDWSNGTYWERCGLARGGEALGRFDLSGRWIALGDLSASCTILQNGSDLKIECPQVPTAIGHIDGAAHFTINWRGQTIGGTVTADRNHINWDDQTYWTRSILYKSSGK
jgi:hypothetical protein